MEPNPSGVRGPSPKPPARGRGRGQLPRPAAAVVVPSPQAIPAAEIGRLAVSDAPVTPPAQPRLALGESSGASQQLEESAAGFPLEAETQVESLSTVGMVPLVKLAERPDVGSVGREIRLRANFFEVDCENARPVYYYRVYIDFASKLNVTDNKLPRKEPGRRDMFTAEDNRLIFWDIIRTNTGNANPNDNIFLHSRGIAYDGANTVLMTHKPLFERGNLSHGVGVFDHEFTLPGLGVPRRFRALWYPRDSGSYTIRAGEGFSGQDPDPAFYFSPNHIIDIFFRQYPSYPSADSRFAPTKRSFFLRPAPLPAAPPIDLTAGKEIWHGYSAATHILSGNKFWMNFDTSNTAFFKSQMLLVSIEELLSSKYGRHSTVPFTPRNTDIAQFLSQVPGASRYLDSELKGVKLKCTHIPPFAAASAASRVYKYKRVHNKNADQEFIAGDEQQQQQQKSITRYFLEKYSLRLRFPHYPLIAVVGRRDENIFLPLEVCRVKDCQPSTRKLNEDQTANMIRAVCWDADERRRRIESMLADVQEPVSEGRYMAELGLSLRPEMAEVNGRVLPAPDIRYANDARPQLRGSWQGEWNHPQPQRGHGVLIKPASFTCSIVCFGVGSDQEPHIENFWRMLRDRAGQFGCQLPAAPVCVNYVSEQHMPQLQGGLNNHKQKMSAEAADRFDNNMITLCIMESKSFYQEIKYTAEIQVGLMTQCILSKNVIPPRGPGNRKPVPSPQTIDNLLLKMNMKMAGENWRVLENLTNLLPGLQLPPALPATSNEQDPPSFLVLGIDVTHPPPGDRRSPSIAAVCCSLDPYFVRYTATVRLQKERREHMVDLKQIVKELYDLYMRRNAGAKPRHIVVYRDGVSDGQFQAVLQEELGSIKEGIASFYGFYADTRNPRPTVTYVVVQKRHHARLFCQDERDKIGRAKNIPPGTCVDQDIVHPDGFDFYLCSHFGIQGTSKPAHYHVLHDNAGFHADQLQLLTFRLCNVYERCARSVSIPAPVYYADLVCRRARTWLDKSFSQLDDSASEGSGGSAANQPGEDDMRAALNLEHSLQEQMYFM